MNSKLLFFGCFFIFFSCSTSNEVVSNNRIQKRKYNKGYHFKKRIEINHNNKNINCSISVCFLNVIITLIYGNASLNNRSISS